MMLNVHYDVDAAVRALEESNAAIKLPASATPYDHLLLRQRPAQVAIFRMLLEEDNRGTPTTDQVKAIAHYVAETISNIADTFENDMSRQLMMFFLGQVTEAYKFVRAEDRSGAIVTSTPVASTRGGRA